MGKFIQDYLNLLNNNDSAFKLALFKSKVMINYIQVYLLPDNLAEFRLMISELILIDTSIQIEDSYYLNLLSTKPTTSLIITVALSDNTKYTKKGI
jgi:hypothetical protein